VRFKINTKQWGRHSRRASDAEHDADDDLRAVVRKVALTVKTDWAGQWAPSVHLPSLGASVSFDVAGGGGVYTAEIGPDKGRSQGPLGTLIEDANGAARNRATHAGNRAGRRAETRFERMVADAGEDGVGG
jgi:hypothetical protein